MKLTLCILILSLFVPAFAQNAFRPDSDTLKKLELCFSGWMRAESSSYRMTPPPAGIPNAWRVVFTREIAGKKNAKTSQRAKGMLIIYLLPENEKFLPERKASAMLKFFNWESTPNDLEQYEMYLGTGRGCHWYAKSDIGRLNFLKENLKISGGEDMMQKMADALNEEDFQLYSSRVAVEYFRGKGDAAVPYIMRSVTEWEDEHGNNREAAPLPHLFALKLAGGKMACDSLMQFAYSKKRKVAEAAIERLLTEPCDAPDKFYLTVMRVPAFTEEALNVFRRKKKGVEILPELRRLASRPRSLQQYSLAIAALREFGEGRNVPEYDSANHIMFRVMRKGDTPDTPQFVTFEDTTLVSENAMEAAERKRIAEFTNQLLTSRDHEAAIIAALSLATYTPPSKNISESYMKRVREIGRELLRKMPADTRQRIFQLLDKNLTETRDRALLRQVAAEVGIRI